MKAYFIAALIAAGPAVAFADECLVGVWQADLQDVASMMAAQMGGTATPIGGSANMTIDAAGSLQITANNMEFAVTPPNAPTVNVTVAGYSRGTLVAEGASFNALVADYRLVGSAMVLGQEMTIPFDSTTGMFGNASGSYTCSSTTLQFEPVAIPGAGGIARVWRRVS